MNIVDNREKSPTLARFTPGNVYSSPGGIFYLCVNAANAYREQPKLLLINPVDGKRFSEALPPTENWTEVEAQLIITHKT